METTVGNKPSELIQAQIAAFVTGRVKNPSDRLPILENIRTTGTDNHLYPEYLDFLR